VRQEVAPSATLRARRHGAALEAVVPVEVVGRLGQEVGAGRRSRPLGRLQRGTGAGAGGRPVLGLVVVLQLQLVARVLAGRKGVALAGGAPKAAGLLLRRLEALGRQRVFDLEVVAHFRPEVEQIFAAVLVGLLLLLLLMLLLLLLMMLLLVVLLVMVGGNGGALPVGQLEWRLLLGVLVLVVVQLLGQLFVGREGRPLLLVDLWVLLLMSCRRRRMLEGALGARELALQVVGRGGRVD